MTWYRHWLHSHALARVRQIEDKWELKFYWMQYGSGTIQEVVGLHEDPNRTFDSEDKCIKELDKLDYVKSEVQNYRAE